MKRNTSGQGACMKLIQDHLDWDRERKSQTKRDMTSSSLSSLVNQAKSAYQTQYRSYYPIIRNRELLIGLLLTSPRSIIVEGHQSTLLRLGVKERQGYSQIISDGGNKHRWREGVVKREDTSKVQDTRRIGNSSYSPYILSSPQFQSPDWVFMRNVVWRTRNKKKRYAYLSLHHHYKGFQQKTRPRARKEIRGIEETETKK